MSTRESERALGKDNLAQAVRQRLGPALEGMARDLAATRRELAASRRENERLRARLDAQSPLASRGSPGAWASPQASAVLLTGHYCPRCGMTVGPEQVLQEQAILAADCCPRCDGRLVARPPAPPSRETSVFLG